MLTYQKRKINICIVTSIRHQMKNPMEKGNFLKIAYFTVIPSDNIFNICSKLQTSVKNTQKKTYFKKNSTFHDFFSPLAFYNVHYAFNNWKDLSSIYTKNNRLLIRQSTHNISKKDIYDLKHTKHTRKAIILDFLDNKYIISNINNF